MITATAAQCSHWRAMFPRWQAVIEFTRQWYAECGCLPTQNNVREIFGDRPVWDEFMAGRYAVKAEARAVLESAK